MTTGPLIPNASKIAVLRANALGDFIFVLPALRALCDSYPQAEIVLLGKEWHKTFIPGRVKTVDRVIAVPPTRGVGEAEDFQNDEAQLDQFFEQMQKEQFDIAIQLHGGGKYSNPFTERLGARVTAGLQAPGAATLDRTIPYAYYQNEILRYLEAVSLVGAKTAEIIPEITVLPGDQKEARALTGQKAYIVIHPGASDPRRRWPPDRFAAAANHFINQGYDVVVTGVSSERAVVEEVVRCTGGKARGLVDEVSLGGLAALCQGSSLVISNDTGPLHLSLAAGAKSVGIFWCGNVINGGPLTRANHRPLLSWIIDCPACGAKEGRCEHDVSFVAGVTTQEVIDAAEELLI